MYVPARDVLRRGENEVVFTVNAFQATEPVDVTVTLGGAYTVLEIRVSDEAYNVWEALRALTGDYVATLTPPWCRDPLRCGVRGKLYASYPSGELYALGVAAAGEPTRPQPCKVVSARRSGVYEFSSVAAALLYGKPGDSVRVELSLGDDVTVRLHDGTLGDARWLALATRGVYRVLGDGTVVVVFRCPLAYKLIVSGDAAALAWCAPEVIVGERAAGGGAA